MRESSGLGCEKNN